MKLRRFGEFKLLETDGPSLVQAIRKAIEDGEHRSILYLNPHIYNLAQRDPALKESLHRADWVLVDGVGLILASRITGERIADRLTLMDYIFPLLETAQSNGWPVFFLGGAHRTTELLKRRLQSRFPQLQIVGCRDGFFNHADDEQIVREINTVAPVLLFAGMGSPRQEKWLIQRQPQLNAQILITAGGSFANLADLIPRAPRWMNANGLEWLYRMLREPARLSSRYITGSLQFGWHILTNYRKQFRF